MQGCGRTSPGGTGIYFCRVPSKTELKFPGGSFGITEKKLNLKVQDTKIFDSIIIFKIERVKTCLLKDKKIGNSK